MLTTVSVVLYPLTLPIKARWPFLFSITMLSYIAQLFLVVAEEMESYWRRRLSFVLLNPMTANLCLLLSDFNLCTLAL